MTLLLKDVALHDPGERVQRERRVECGSGIDEGVHAASPCHQKALVDGPAIAQRLIDLGAEDSAALIANRRVRIAKVAADRYRCGAGANDGNAEIRERVLLLIFEVERDVGAGRWPPSQAGVDQKPVGADEVAKRIVVLVGAREAILPATVLRDGATGVPLGAVEVVGADALLNHRIGRVQPASGREVDDSARFGTPVQLRRPFNDLDALQVSRVEIAD